MKTEPLTHDIHTRRTFVHEVGGLTRQQGLCSVDDVLSLFGRHELHCAHEILRLRVCQLAGPARVVFVERCGAT